MPRYDMGRSDREGDAGHSEGNRCSEITLFSLLRIRNLGGPVYFPSDRVLSRGHVCPFIC